MINVLISALIIGVDDEVNSDCTNTATPSRALGTFVWFILVSLFLFYLHCNCLDEYMFRGKYSLFLFIQRGPRSNISHVVSSPIREVSERQLMQGISPINTCKQHLHDRIISQRGDIFIKVHVPSQKCERSRIMCVFSPCFHDLLLNFIQLFPVSEGQSAARKICLSSRPVFFANNPHQQDIFV